MSTAIKFGELYHGFEIRNPRNAEESDGLREFRDTVVTRVVCGGGGVLTGIAFHDGTG